MDESMRFQAEMIWIGVAFLTLWLEPDRQAAKDHILAIVHDPDGPGIDAILTGQLTLSMFLIMELARKQGDRAPSTISPR